MTARTSGSANPFRDDLCVAILTIPGYSLTECAILQVAARHAWWGKKTCLASPEEIADELKGKVTVRTVQRSFLKFESNGLAECVKKTRGVGATRETALTEKFWALVSAELARINPERYGSEDPIDKRHGCRLGCQSQTTPEALQTTPVSFQTTFGVFQTTPEALQTTPVSFALKDIPSVVNDSSSSSSSSSPPGEIRDDDEDDDVRCAQGKEEKTSETDAEGAEMVTKVITKCTHVGKLGFTVSDALGHRINHDWRSFAIAVMRLELKFCRREIHPSKKIESPIGYLVKMMTEKITSGETEDLKRSLDELLEPVRSYQDQVLIAVREMLGKAKHNSHDEPDAIKDKILTWAKERHPNCVEAVVAMLNEYFGEAS